MAIRAPTGGVEKLTQFFEDPARLDALRSGDPRQVEGVLQSPEAKALFGDLNTADIKRIQHAVDGAVQHTADAADVSMAYAVAASLMKVVSGPKDAGISQRLEKLFGWMGTGPGDASPEANSTERLHATADLSIQNIMAYTLGKVFEGREAPKRFNETDLSGKEAHRLAVARRVVLGALYASPAMDLASALGKRSEQSVAAMPRYTHSKEPETRNRGSIPFFTTKAGNPHWNAILRRPFSEYGDKLDKLGFETHKGYVQSDFTGPARGPGEGYGQWFINRATVSESGYGEPLARALVETTRITMFDAGELGERLKDNGVLNKEVLGRFNQAHSSAVLAEFCHTMTAALSLLLAQKPVGEDGHPLSADEALAKIAESDLLVRMAFFPLAVIAPLNLTGTLPSDPIEFVDGKAKLPASLVALSKEVGEGRTLVSKETLNHPHVKRYHSDVTFSTETLKGCPVAMNGPVVGANGELSLTEEPPIKHLQRAFIDIARKVLAEQQTT